MSYKCKNSQFTEEQYDAHSKHFWRIPTEWGDPASTLLKDVRAVSRCAIRLLPLLGHAASMRYGTSWNRSLEEAARLAGIDAKSCKKAARGLEELQLVTTKPVLYRGVRLTEWSLSAALAAAPDSPRYFGFSMSLVYGGNWSRLSSPQCAVYLAAATKAFTISDAETREHVNGVLEYIDPTELEDCFDANERRYRRHGRSSARVTRVAIVSKSELAQITGYSKGAIDDAVRGLQSLGALGADDYGASCCPLFVYPRNQGSLLYHFRDHAEPWSWSDLNDAPPSREVSSTSSYDDDSDELPF